MFEFARLILFCAVVWIMWLAIPIAAALIGTVLALWVLYFFSKVVTEDIDNDNREQGPSDGPPDSP